MLPEGVLKNFIEKIEDTFVALEEEVKIGRIRSYGVSSSAFSSMPEAMFPFKRMLHVAAVAASKVGNKSHSFKTIEFPLNLLERRGLAVAQWAKQKGLRVVTSRPLTGVTMEGAYRLVGEPVSSGRSQVKKA